MLAGFFDWGEEMDVNVDAFRKRYIANAQVDLSVAQLTKVPRSWGETNFVPDFNKFYFIQSGSGFVKLGDQLYYPKPGELYLLPAGTVQSYGNTSEDTFNKYWCHFTAKVGESHLFNLIQAPIFIEINQVKKMKDQFEHLIHLMESPSISALFQVKAILLQWIAMMLETNGQIQSQHYQNPSYEKIDYVIRYVESHLHESFSNEQLAAIAGFHPNYFIQLFKQYTGTTPIRFLNQHRMGKARHMVEHTNLNISEIAESVGMDVSYFSRMFREHTGFSPSQYRELSVYTSELMK